MLMLESDAIECEVLISNGIHLKQKKHGVNRASIFYGHVKLSER